MNLLYTRHIAFVKLTRVQFLSNTIQREYIETYTLCKSFFNEILVFYFVHEYHRQQRTINNILFSVKPFAYII